MSINLVLRVHEVDVTGGAHRLVEGFCPGPTLSVEVPELLPVSTMPSRRSMSGVVADGLNLQVVIPGGNAHQLVPTFPLHNGPE